jgi:hypothetical protein
MFSAKSPIRFVCSFMTTVRAEHEPVVAGQQSHHLENVGIQLATACDRVVGEPDVAGEF